MSHHLLGRFVRWSKHSLSLDFFLHPCLETSCKSHEKSPSVDCLMIAGTRSSSDSKTFNSFDESAWLMAFKNSSSTFLNFFNAGCPNRSLMALLTVKSLKIHWFEIVVGCFWMISIALRPFVANNVLQDRIIGLFLLPW